VSGRPVCWRTISIESLAWQRFDDELVVCNSRTGSTHLLDSLYVDVFNVLVHGDAAMTVDQVVDLLGEGATDECAAAIRKILQNFEALGLATAASA
jgi:PqqD family protein of HPr-rel-A system